MKVKFLSGPKAGQISHAERTQATQLLIDAGIVEIFDEELPIPPAHAARWVVGKVGVAGDRPVIKFSCPRSRVEFFFDGKPEDAHALVIFDCGEKLALPADVIETYRKLYRGPVSLGEEYSRAAMKQNPGPGEF